MNASDFNKKYSVGDEIIYVNDFGEDEHLTLTSEAWTIGSGAVVVKISGKSGGYSIDRIKSKS